MQLNINSFTARLYRWFYYRDTMPNNLCPYFWQLVLMWLVIVPYTVFTLPVQLYRKFKENEKGEILAISMFSYLVLFFISCLILAIGLFFTKYPKGGWFETAALLGAFIWLILIVLGGWKLIDICYDKYGDRISIKSDKPSLIVEFAKAKYNKYCPKIDWKK